MGFVYIALVLAGSLLLGKRLFGAWVSALRGRRLGCSAAKRYPHWDWIFGFDLFWKQRNLALDLRTLPAGMERHQRYGSTYWSLSFGVWSINTIEPENIRCAYSPQHGEWSIGAARLKGLQPLCGHGFITTSGPLWARSRKLLQPAFARSNIADLGPFKASVAQLLQKLPDDGSTIDLQPLFQQLFLDTAAQFLMGQTLGILSDSEDAVTPVSVAAFLYNFQQALIGFGLRAGLGRLKIILPDQKWKEACAVVHSYVDYHVDQRLAQRKSAGYGAKREAPGSQTLLDNLLDQIEDRVEIRNQIIQAMMAAQDTTSNLISNTVWLLARHPKVWSQVRGECLALEEAELDFERIRSLKTLRTVLQESLRLYPVFAMNGREAVNDTVLPCGGGPDGRQPVFVPRGSTVTISFYALHRDPIVFGADVEQFRPERWLTISPEPWQYLPFGGGERACMGRPKALVEASYILVQLARRFVRFESRDDRPWAGRMKLTAMNARGCLVGAIPASNDEQALPR